MKNPDGMFYVKPTTHEVRVRNPERGGHLDPEGDYVPRNAYWIRRINDGDIVETKPPKKASARSTNDQE